jgi:UDP:flavonoid glycosyltransferase YjiC (YdhE family)
VEKAELESAIDGLLANAPLRERMAAISQQIRAEDGVRREAEIIADLGQSAAR